MSQETILILDDNEPFVRQTTAGLEEAGYAVVTATNRSDAEALIEKHQINMALVALMLEEEDTGFVVCYHIKKNYPNVKIIMITKVFSETGIEFDAATEEERAWVKADALLSEPIRMEQILTEIERLKS